MFREARAVAFSSLFFAVATVSGRLCVVAVKSGFQFVWRLSEAQSCYHKVIAGVSV